MANSKKWLVLLPVLVPWLIFVVTGLLGIDYGLHWDERSFIERIARGYAEGTILPHNYDYPSFIYWPFHLALVPDILEAKSQAAGDTMRFRQIMFQRLQEYYTQITLHSTAPDKAATTRNKFTRFMNPRGLPPPNAAAHRYHMRVRFIVLLISSLMVVWVYLYAWRARGDAVEALIAASVLAGSWEMAYHARWIAADALTSQFAALTVFLSLGSLLSPAHKVRWISGGALAAGVACSTKYPLGLVLLPVLVACLAAYRGAGKWGRTFVVGVQAVLIFLAAFVAITPGLLLEPDVFQQGIEFSMKQYATGHVQHTVHGGLPHLAKVLQYYSLVLLSHVPAIAVFLFALAVLGVVSLARRRPMEAAILLVFPVAYVGYMTRQSVMTVRNFLAVTPFLAILSGRGAMVVAEFLARPVLRKAWLGVVFAALLVNAAWLFQAAGTIRARGTMRFVREAAAYVDRHPDIRFWASPVVRKELDLLDGKARPNLTTNLAESVFVIFHHHEEGSMEAIDWFPTNDPHLTVTWFGPYEVNFNYYGSWAGDDRILVMETEKAKRLKVKSLR